MGIRSITCVLLPGVCLVSGGVVRADLNRSVEWCVVRAGQTTCCAPGAGPGGDVTAGFCCEYVVVPPAVAGEAVGGEIVVLDPPGDAHLWLSGLLSLLAVHVGMSVRRGQGWAAHLPDWCHPTEPHSDVRAMATGVRLVLSAACFTAESDSPQEITITAGPSNGSRGSLGTVKSRACPRGPPAVS